MTFRWSRLASTPALLFYIVVTLAVGVSALLGVAVTSSHEARDAKAQAAHAEVVAQQAVQNNNAKFCSILRDGGKLPAKIPISTRITPTGVSLVQAVEQLGADFRALLGDFGC